ncbi:hypothetical protein V6N13_128455 [Hibiscus sabdariffa]|uniref:Uncharacterized protein n=1 Tax=Hibiscus sabdariffa TaxID=183260 RepID=A0ABR2P1A2_9ROSI
MGSGLGNRLTAKEQLAYDRQKGKVPREEESFNTRKLPVKDSKARSRRISVCRLRALPPMNSLSYSN